MTALDKYFRRSPVHELLGRTPVWNAIADMPVAVRFESGDVEQSAIRTLAICDVSALPKLGIKGSDAENLLIDEGIDIPQQIYETRALPDGGLIARLGSSEFLLESGLANETVTAVANRLQAQPERALVIERQDATFLLFGQRACEVFSQTCGLDMSVAPLRQLILTRVAGVSCGILPEELNGIPVYRLWIDYSYAAGLWESLTTICGELGGAVVGAGSVWPELD